MKITYSYEQAFHLANYWLGVKYLQGNLLVICEPTEDYLAIVPDVHQYAPDETLICPHQDTGEMYHAEGVKVFNVPPHTFLADETKDILTSHGIPLDTGWMPDIPLFVSNGSSITDCRTGETDVL